MFTVVPNLFTIRPQSLLNYSPVVPQGVHSYSVTKCQLLCEVTGATSKFIPVGAPEITSRRSQGEGGRSTRGSGAPSFVPHANITPRPNSDISDVSVCPYRESVPNSPDTYQASFWGAGEDLSITSGEQLLDENLSSNDNLMIGESDVDGDTGDGLRNDVDDELPGEDFVFTPTDFGAVEIRRSARRKRTVTAYRENGRTIVVAPQRMSARDVETYARELVGRLDVREQRASSGPALYARAERLVAEFLDRDVLANRDIDIRWVTNQNGRWGSCTPRQGRIRLSHRLMDMPDYVIDSVLLHELAHLIVSNHGPKFQALVNCYPQLVQADAYLAGYSLAMQKGLN